MALEGSLKEFGLADILQLIYYQRKTGVLSIESKLDRVRLLFYEGRIVSAESKRRAEDGRLGRILVKKGIMSEDGLKEAVAEQKSSGGKLGHVLIRKGLMEKEQLREILSGQITEIITQLFSWKEGRYEFKPQGVPVDKEVPLDLDTQHILMDGLRIVDEWSLLEGKITVESVFEKTSKDAEGSSELEKELLGHIDSRSDVATIADLSGRDNFEVSKAMLGLLEKELISPVATEAAEEPKAEAPAAPRALRAPLAKILITASALVSLALALLIAQGQRTELRPLRASESVDKMRFLIEAYSYENGSCPQSLEEIIGPVSGKTDPWGSAYVYSLAEGGFTLYSPGPDGLPGTPDDIY